MNLLLDTNVYIDYLGRKEPFFKDAQKIIMAGFFNDASLWLPAQSVTDAFYVLKKYVESDRVKKAIEESLNLINLVSLSQEDVRRGLKSNCPDLEDALILQSVEKAKADYLITRDSGHFQNALCSVVTPDEWCLMMKEEKGVAYEEVFLD